MEPFEAAQRPTSEIGAGKAVRLPLLPTFPFLEAGGWEDVNAALADAPALSLGQAWRSSVEEAFRPGTVRLGWREGTIIVAASLGDDSVFTRATTDNQRLWELGDVFEIFLRDEEREDYLELHVAPGGQRLQLRFASRQIVARLRGGFGRLEDHMVKEPLFDFRTRELAGGWALVAQIPGSSLGWEATTLQGRRFFASFSRYDYAADGRPAVLSSTSLHAKPDFHRQEEWAILICC